MKKVLSVLVVCCLLVALLPAAVTAATYGDLSYSVSGGKATITGCDPSAIGAVTIPDAIAGYPVATIAASAFDGCAGVTTITIGKNVTTIGNTAFTGCTGLEAINVDAGNLVYIAAGNCLIEKSSKTLIAGCKNSIIPADGSVTAIANMAFYNCTGLAEIAIPDAVKTIGASAFEGCKQLTAADLGKGVTAIGNSAFFGCSKLEAIAIPDSVTTMGVYAFSGCTGLTSVTMGEGLTTIGNSTFSGCTGLTDLTIGKNVVTIDVFAFSGCESLGDVAIPGSLTTIGKFAFYNCTGLESVQIPVSVTSIGNNAFSGCNELKMSINEENTYAANYAKNNGIAYQTFGLGSIAVTTVVLKPGAAGIYFTGNLDWAAKDTNVLSYGFAVSLENALPVADGSDETCLYTQGNTSVLVKEIMKSENTATENNKNARATIYARAYVQLADGSYVYSEAVEVSLIQVVMGAQNQWNKLSDNQKEALLDMYQQFEEVMRFWKVPNLKAA